MRLILSDLDMVLQITETMPCFQVIVTCDRCGKVVLIRDFDTRSATDPEAASAAFEDGLKTLKHECGER